MSITIEAQSPDVRGDIPANNKEFRFVAADSPLAKKLGTIERSWLMRHLTDRFSALDGNMNSWRGKMAKWERMSEEDYKDRIGQRDDVNPSNVNDIFLKQNESLGVVAGFNDFHFAQAKDDIFGTRPWLAATPEGKDDYDLADVMTKHAQWKLNQSDVEQTLVDALKISTWGGTAFVKAAHAKEIEEFEKIVSVAHWTPLGAAFWKKQKGQPVKAGEPIYGAGGDYAQTQDELVSMGLSKEHIEWRKITVTDTQTVYGNVTNQWIDYRDIAFETTAPELTLRHTDVFLQFRMGLLDLMERYGIDESHKPGLMGILGATGVAKDHRNETEPGLDLLPEYEGNPPVKLVEGYVRCAPFRGKSPVRIHAIFSPDLNILFSVDYLANVTPGGILPVFPVRINKIPGRVFGVGYYEKYESTNNAIDRHYNQITYRNRHNAHVWTAFQPDALADHGEGQNEYELDSAKPMKLAPDKTIADAIQFAVAPDNNARSEMLLNSQMQMIQMRSGITSAAQGELKGVPSASTATGTRDLQSRGATLVKCPIDEQTKDIQKIVEFDVILIYANQDRDETFTWGEGREASLLAIRAEDVLGIKANVTLTLTQAQNQQKLQSAMTAIDIVTKYIAIPEMEKPAARFAFVQALSSVGFHNAQEIIRDAAVDPAGILALMPPEIKPIVEQALAQAGFIAPKGDSQGQVPVENAAPVSDAA